MKNRIILHVSAVLVSTVLAGIAVAASSANAAPDADDKCLTKPNRAPPQGRHWYYHTDRINQRKCWYLGDDDTEADQDAPAKRTISAKPAVSSPKIAIEPPVANANAKLIDEQSAKQSEARPSQPQPEMGQGTPDSFTTPARVVTSRWPEPMIAPAADRVAAVSAPAPAAQIENPQPVAAGEPVAPAQQPSELVDNSNYVSNYVLFAMFAAALALVALVGGAIFRLFAAKRLDPRDFPSEHRVARNDRRADKMPPAFVGRPAARPRVASDRMPERRRLSDEIEELDQLLAAARRRAD